nr:ATP-binding protein [Roseimaritima sediminicola]
MQSMATLGELTSTATHEFNNVLTTVINYARLGIRNKDESSRDKAFDRILDASQRAAKITATILAQARHRDGELKPTDVRELIADSLVLLEREMRKYRVSIETDLADDTPLAVANANQIQRVLLNLLINARQAMPEGGTVLIQTRADGGELVLSVRDYGSGIAASELPKIFQPFYSTKQGPDESGKGGTGLGLAACKEIIETHRGRIRVESTVGKGTAFIIRLPATDEQTAAA